MLYAFDYLYVDGFGKDKSGKDVFGLFRCQSTHNDDTFDKVEFLREWQTGAGEHGAHAIVLGPDKKLYIVMGNFTTLPADMLPSSPHRHYADDLILPRAEDGAGFGAGKKPPGGSIVRLDPDGSHPELFASGDRNTYDIAFNADGELFGFDSDMEWDWGAPWYRPIRVYHATSGADQGFREGSAKWPEYYPDSLPSASTVGIGCPTGVIFGYGAKFPGKYQKAYFALDWTYGRLIAVHLTPQGSTYTGEWENFVATKSLHDPNHKTALNLTDVIIGDDGAMYFCVGGRGTQSYLYRVSYIGKESTEPVDPHDTAGAEDRAMRHELEKFHGHEDAKVVETAWPSLSSPDRFMRYAARIAIESQPIEQWQQRALKEKNVPAALTSLLALARIGGTAVQADLLDALQAIPFSSLSEEQQLDLLRDYEVSIARQGRPSPQQCEQIVAELDPHYPAASIPLNRELCQLMLALDAPDAVAKTMKLLAAAPTQEEQLSYILYLRTIKRGWTMPLRKQYFEWFTKFEKDAKHLPVYNNWFEDAGRPFSDGPSVPKFVANFHTEAQNLLSPDDKKELATVIGAFAPAGEMPLAPTVKGRYQVRNWKMTDLEPLLDQVGKGRDFARGQKTFHDAQCIACHRFGNEGGSVGPDLTAVSSRFHRRDILESIILPSKVIAEQYQNTIIHTKGGDVYEGKIVEETDDHVTVQPAPLLPTKIVVKKTDIKSRSLSKVSPMPEQLVDTFTKEEILDLIAYLESGGRKDHPDFKK